MRKAQRIERFVRQMFEIELDTDRASGRERGNEETQMELNFFFVIPSFERLR